MRSRFIEIITSDNPAVRDTPVEAVAAGATLEDLFAEAKALDEFRRNCNNLYERVRALFYLYALHRFFIPEKLGADKNSLLSFKGYNHLLQRRFEEALDTFLDTQKEEGASDTTSSALAAAYYRLGIQTLADQVRRSVRSVRGNQWMFRMGHPADHPLRVRQELLQHDADGAYPVLFEQTPVRMDLTHSGWSDIFFLGMDFPEGAKVLNISIDLGVSGRDKSVQPPVEAYFRVIEEPVLRLTSVDLGASAEIRHLSEVFDFARDYLGLLKAAVIASGLVPPGIEGSGHDLPRLLETLVGSGRGIELVSNVNGIPKGSRLAVSTNLLACLISVCMRATGQARSLEGALEEHERRLALARAILGEWLGGSGGGWQDSGGVWPGIKLIEGVLASEGDPEFGVSRGRLMPQHQVLGQEEAPAASREALQKSLVLVHGGMAQNVGPILEMVTEKYLLRSQVEWKARLETLGILKDILAALKAGDVRALGKATTRNFRGPIQTIIPWATNFYTETLIQKAEAEFGEKFWGFWMLGGMSGGGMGFIFAPEVKEAAKVSMQKIMSGTKKELEHALPFAMEPVVYDFAINERGTWATLLKNASAILPAGYYTLTVPALIRTDTHALPQYRRIDLDRFSAACRTRPELSGTVQALFNRLLPQLKIEGSEKQSLSLMLAENGFDPAQHEQIRSDLQDGRIGLAQNRLPAATVIEDVEPGDVIDSEKSGERKLGENAIKAGQVAVFTLAAGAGSRWTQGAGVVKALHPFAKLGGRHRTFLEVHIAKSRQTSRKFKAQLPHLISTSYLTHAPIQEFLDRAGKYNYEAPIHLSAGKSVGLRLVPMARDLRFAWEEMPQQLLDEQAQKVRQSLHTALIDWAKRAGEGSDYTDNLPNQCLHPIGHWYEVPNLLRNGTLLELYKTHPNLRYLMLHNIDTVGANVDPALLGLHINEGSCLSYEVINRRIEDRGGGLARVNGKPRILEGLAMPREEAEFQLSYYNTLTSWIDLDQLLGLFGLTKDCLKDAVKVSAAIRTFGARLPTYVTLKDVKKRWGHGQEDVFPVAQFEKLWGDMTALPEVSSSFFVVPRSRGQQLKEQAQLDGWMRDGSAAWVESLCDWG